VAGNQQQDTRTSEQLHLHVPRFTDSTNHKTHVHSVITSKQYYDNSGMLSETGIREIVNVRRTS